MKTIPYFELNAFASQPFSGNPAGVCALPHALSPVVMQKIAAQNNLSETAFFYETGQGHSDRGRFNLRWFTPEVEVDLCGHATLASGAVLFRYLKPELSKVEFDTASGTLSVTRGEGLDWLDLPSRAPEPVDPPELLLRALGVKPRWVGRSRDYLVELESEGAVRAVRPDFTELAKVDAFGVLVTAPGRGVDFVSRCFFPGAGVPEDPVTGSAHCTLAPFWAKRLGKTTLTAHQLSARGGELRCELRGDRVLLGGRAETYLRGELYLPDDA